VIGVSRHSTILELVMIYPPPPTTQNEPLPKPILKDPEVVSAALLPQFTPSLEYNILATPVLIAKYT
jgi:hypothetical protein